MLATIDGRQYDLTNLDVGETVAWCHETCEAGQDTRFRMYFTRPTAEPNKVLWFCHNCQTGGKLDIDEPYRVQEVGKQRIDSIVCNSKFERPSSLIEIDHAPPAARAWVYKNFGTQNVPHFVMYDPTTNRVYLPVYDFSGDMCAYQLRLVEGTGPKYITVKRDKDTELAMTFEPEHVRPKGNVIVEDLASAWALHMFTDNVNVLCNYGVQVKLEVLNELSRLPTLIWLDNDNDTVREQARKMQRTLEILGFPKVRLATTENLDPKHATPEEIEEQLEWIL